MKLWLILGILSYVSYAISTSIDKFMMKLGIGVYKANTLKSLFDGTILLIIGFLFFSLNFNKQLLIGALILGIIYAVSSIIYFSSLKLKDVSIVMPYSQAAQILLIFIASLLLFKESANINNYVGVILIIIGIYAVLSEKFKLPKIDKGLILISLMIIFHVIYFLLVKFLVFDVDPLSLGVTQYYAGTIILFIYLFFFRKKDFKSLFRINADIPKIGAAALFGALGTFLLFTALSIGDASKVYPIAGVQLVFIFIIASIFLKEKFYWHRLIGTTIVFLGIYLISI